MTKQRRNYLMDIKPTNWWKVLEALGIVIVIMGAMITMWVFATILILAF